MYATMLGILTLAAYARTPRDPSLGGPWLQAYGTMEQVWLGHHFALNLYCERGVRTQCLGALRSLTAEAFVPVVAAARASGLDLPYAEPGVHRDAGSPYIRRCGPAIQKPWCRVGHLWPPRVYEAPRAHLLLTLDLHVGRVRDPQSGGDIQARIGALYGGVGLGDEVYLPETVATRMIVNVKRMGELPGAVAGLLAANLSFDREPYIGDLTPD